MTSEEQAGLEQEIERTREQLGQTVEALAAKADVKAQARVKAAQVTGRLRRVAVQAADTGRERRVQLVTAAGAVVLAWLLIARWRQR